MNKINTNSTLPSRNDLLFEFDSLHNKQADSKYFECVNERIEDYDLDSYCKNTCS